MIPFLLGLLVGSGVMWLVQRRRFKVTFNEPRIVPQKEWLTSPKGVTQFFESVSFAEKYKEAKSITDTLE